jgi:hypothetical protein
MSANSHRRKPRFWKITKAVGLLVLATLLFLLGGWLLGGFCVWFLVVYVLKVDWGQVAVLGFSIGAGLPFFIFAVALADICFPFLKRLRVVLQNYYKARGSDCKEGD